MMMDKYDGTEAPAVHTKSGDVPTPILSRGDDSVNPRRNHRLKKVLALSGGLAAAGLIITFIIERSAG